jgi:ATP/ADP translocase
MSAVGNLAPMVSGFTVAALSHSLLKKYSDEDQVFETSLKVFSCLITIAGTAIFAFHRYLTGLEVEDIARELNAAAPINEYDRHGVQSLNEQQLRSMTRKQSGMSSNHFSGSSTDGSVLQRCYSAVVESWRFVMGDPYLRQLAVIVLGHGIATQISDAVWKGALSEAIPEKVDYLRFMGRYSLLSSISAFLMFFVGPWFAGSFPWEVGALFTPVFMALSAIPLFIFVLKARGITVGVDGGNFVGDRAIAITPKLIMLLSAAYVGLLQNVLGKTSKYAIFDPSKELVYVPLGRQQKQRAKVAIDVVGNRMGRIVGETLLQTVILTFGGIVAGAPMLGVIFYAIIAMWICK